MTTQVRIREEAEIDLSDAVNWYENQRLGLGQDFLDQFQTVLEFLADQPAQFPMVHSDDRRALLGRFPFGIFYSVKNDFILVLAVMHARRNPQNWKNRNRSAASD
jgi:plasmid stabilization system protein ParE